MNKFTDDKIHGPHLHTELNTRKPIFFIFNVYIIIVLFLTSSVSAGDWDYLDPLPENARYIEDDTLAQDLVLSWKLDLGSEIWSSPIIHRDTVYIATIEGQFYGIDVKEGAIEWKYDLGSQSLSSPMVAEGMLFIGDSSGILHSFKLGTDQEMDPSPSWTFETGKGIRSAPTYSNGKVLVGSTNHRVYALDIQSGMLLWSFEAEDVIASSPKVHEDHVFISDYGGYVHAIEVADGSLVWSTHVGGYIFSSPSISDGVLYIQVNGVFALDIEDGTILWTGSMADTQSEDSGWGEGTPAVSNEIVVVGNDNEWLVAFDKETGDRLWAYSDGSAICSSPLIVGDRVFFGTDGERFYELDAENGGTLWSYRTDGDMDSSPTTDGEYVVVGSRSGSLFAFGAQTTVQDNEDKPTQKDIKAILLQPFNVAYIIGITVLVYITKEIFSTKKRR